MFSGSSVSLDIPIPPLPLMFFILLIYPIIPIFPVLLILPIIFILPIPKGDWRVEERTAVNKRMNRCLEPINRIGLVCNK